MGAKSRLLLIERIITEDNAPSPAKLIDITMLVLTGGKERTRAEYYALLADSGLVPERVVPVDGVTSVIEAKLA